MPMEIKRFNCFLCFFFFYFFSQLQSVWKVVRKIIPAAIVKFSIKINESIRRGNLFVFMAIFTHKHTCSTI